MAVITEEVLLASHGWRPHNKGLSGLGDFPGGPVAKTVQKDKLYCAHASSEKSYLFIITSQNTPMEQLATAQ